MQTISLLDTCGQISTSASGLWKCQGSTAAAGGLSGRQGQSVGCFDAKAAKPAREPCSLTYRRTE